ncbi:hypothetical protein JL720_2523 [Aureococcus anophagefferens]|nr:hypothetical protein JL720_2523 [Aureococcus anophagefferens]
MLFVAFVHGSSEIPPAVLTAYEESTFGSQLALSAHGRDQKLLHKRRAASRPRRARRPLRPRELGRADAAAARGRTGRVPRRGADARRRAAAAPADARAQAELVHARRDARRWTRRAPPGPGGAALGGGRPPGGAPGRRRSDRTPARRRTGPRPRRLYVEIARGALPFLNPVVFKKGILRTFPVHFGGEGAPKQLRRLLTNCLWWTGVFAAAAAGLLAVAGAAANRPASRDAGAERRPLGLRRIDVASADVRTSARPPRAATARADAADALGGRDQDAGRAQVVMGAMAQLGVTYEVAIGGLYWVCIKVPMALLLCLGVALMCALQICADAERDQKTRDELREDAASRKYSGYEEDKPKPKPKKKAPGDDRDDVELETWEPDDDEGDGDGASSRSRLQRGRALARGAADPTRFDQHVHVHFLGVELFNVDASHPSLLGRPVWEVHEDHRAHAALKNVHVRLGGDARPFQPKPAAARRGAPGGAAAADAAAATRRRRPATRRRRRPATRRRRRGDAPPAPPAAALDAPRRRLACDRSAGARV